MTELDGGFFRVRPAEPDDVDFLVDLLNDENVEPFLGGRSARARDELLAEIERARREPEAFGRLVIEVDGDPVGTMGFECTNVRSRIARLERLALHPRARGRGVADQAARLLQRYLIRELGYHRLELQIYGFNERAIRHAERAGFVREGVLRKAYRRHGGWQDAVVFSLLEEELPD
jgi:RimJ/RimL family protein N-acetyltransferase